MKRSLIRPTAALFPMVLLVAALFGNDVKVGKLFLYYCVIQLFSLCSVDSFRNAAAREPGIRRVDRRFSGTWLVVVFGIAACVIADHFVGIKQNWMMLIAAGCIIIEQLFEERMYALSHPSDGVILSVVSNALLLAGMLIDSNKGVTRLIDIPGFYTACGAGLGMMISIISSYIIEPMHAFSLVPCNIGFFPKAAIQVLLYPAITMLFRNSAASMVGLVIWRLSRTVCRRAQDESRPLNLILMVACCVPAIAAIWLNCMSGYAQITALAMICAVIVYCAPGWRIYTGTALIIAANILSAYRVLPEQLNMVAVLICSAIAVILNLHKAFLKKI